MKPSQRSPYQFTQNVKKALRNPWRGLKVFRAMIRGSFYILFFRITGKNVRIQFPFFVSQKVTISGPGTVKIGRACNVHPNNFHGLTILTVAADAEVSIGSGCSIGGLTIICGNKIVVGNRCMFGYSLVQDTLFFNTKDVKSRYFQQALASSAPITLGSNLWVCNQSFVLQGASIGDDSVIGIGALCMHKDIKNFHLCMGNPTARTIPIDKLQRLKRL